jgi:hypothetical protein
MRVIFLLLVWTSAAFAEDFRFEITANYWPLNPTGTVLTPTDQVDLQSDLGIKGRKSEALLKVVFKPARKHRLNFEAVPYRFNGANAITRTFTFGGVTFPPHLDPSTSLVVVPIDLLQVRSQIDIDYYFGSYQYDFVSNTRGHVGIIAGVAYFHAKGVLQTPPIVTQLHSLVISPTATEERSVPLPLIGGEFRYFLPPTTKLLNINGEVNGMSLGSEGKYVQGNLNAGVAVLPILRLQAGINVVDADFHNGGNTRGFKLRFAGPIFAVQIHD